MTIEFKNLYKSYGDNEILHGISFKVDRGDPMAFLGRNGAGKTTMIRGFMNVFKFDSGEILIDGKEFKTSDYRIGYLPEERGLYQKHKILDQLIYFSNLRGIDKKTAKNNIMDLLEKVGLHKQANKKLETLSKGNQQKVQIVQALMNDPEIVILDEPFSGLDPLNSKILRDLVKEITAKGNYLIFSSHQMGYVEDMCDSLTIIDDGHIVESDSIEKIKKDMGEGRINISAENMNKDELKLYLRSQMEYLKIEEREKGLVIKLIDKSKDEFLQDLLDIGVTLEEFSNYKPTLYDIFLTKVGVFDE